MKLACVVPVYRPATRFGGPVRSVHALAAALVELGHQVTIFTTNSNGSDDLEVPLDRDVRIDGVEVRYFPVCRPRGFFRSPALASALRERIASFDLAYVPWIYAHTTFAALRACRKAHVPFVISPRGMLDKNAVAQKGRLRKLGFVRVALAGGFKSAAAIHFSADAERLNAIVRVDPARCLVVPNGISLPPAPFLATEAREASIPLVLFLGRLSYIKGLDLLVAAWPRVTAAIPCARLVIAGPDDESLGGGLRQRLAEAGVEASVEFTGMLEGERKEDMLRRCTVLANPSWLESFGMSIVEAMAHSKPVVVTDRVNIASDIDAAGAGIVTPCDAGAVAEAIIVLLRDDARAQRMGAAGRQLVEKRYGLLGVARAMDAAFRRIVEARDFR